MRRRLPRADRRHGPGQRPHAAAGDERLGRRHPRARLGARQGPRVSRVPAGRDAGRAGRLVRPAGRHGRWPEPYPAADRRGSGRAAGRVRPRRRRIRRDRQRRPPPDVGDRSGRPAGRGDGQPDDVVGVRAVDRRDLRRTPSRQLRHRRRLGCRPDPAARRRRPPDPRARAPRADPDRPARAPPARGRLAAPERRRVRLAVRRLRARDLGRRRRAGRPAHFRAGRTGGSSSSRASRRTDRGRAGGPGLHDPPLRGRRRDRDDHARSTGGAQRADRGFEAGAARRLRTGGGRPRPSERSC